MKLSYYRLTEHLAKGKILPVYVVMGEQDLLRELAIAEIKRGVVGEEETPSHEPARWTRHRRGGGVLASAGRGELHGLVLRIAY